MSDDEAEDSRRCAVLEDEIDGLSTDDEGSEVPSDEESDFSSEGGERCSDTESDPSANYFTQDLVTSAQHQEDYSYGPPVGFPSYFDLTRSQASSPDAAAADNAGCRRSFTQNNRSTSDLTDFSELLKPVSLWLLEGGDGMGSLGIDSILHLGIPHDQALEDFSGSQT